MMIKHPAKYNDAFIPIFAEMLKGRKRILDPFSGTGKIFGMREFLSWNTFVVGVEIERLWAFQSKKNIVGNVLYLPFKKNTFDAAVTSCTYGNRMADTLLDKYKRITYTSFLGKKLHEDNSGSLQWGKKYKEFHIQAWTELTRVLKNKAVFVLNIKDHIRAGKRQRVGKWHVEALSELGFEVIERRKVKVESMGFGQNSKVRVPYEDIIKFILYK